MSGARTRTRQHTRDEPEQTHDDCRWLDEEDREQEMARDGARLERFSLSEPAASRREVGDTEERDGLQHRSRHEGGLNGRRTTGVARVGRRAAAVCLRLHDDVGRTGGAPLSLSGAKPFLAAGLPGFGGRFPARTLGQCRDENCQHEDERRSSPEGGAHETRTRERLVSVKSSAPLAGKPVISRYSRQR